VKRILLVLNLVLMSVAPLAAVAVEADAPAAAETNAPATAEADAPATTPEREPYRDPEWTAVRSLVVPGWGQQLNGDHTKGFILTSAALVGVLLGVGVISPGLLSSADDDRNLERAIGWFLYGTSVVWAVGDAYLRAQALNRENGYDLSAIESFPQGHGSSPVVAVTVLRLGF